MCYFALNCRKSVVVGAGYIAIELAGILHALGSDTSLVIRKDKVRIVVHLHGLFVCYRKAIFSDQCLGIVVTV